MGSMDELRSPSLPTSPAAPVIVFPSPSMLSVLQLLGTIRCPKKPRAAHKRFLRHIRRGVAPLRRSVGDCAAGATCARQGVPNAIITDGRCAVVGSASPAAR